MVRRCKGTLWVGNMLKSSLIKILKKGYINTLTVLLQAATLLIVDVKFLDETFTLHSFYRTLKLRLFLGGRRRVGSFHLVSGLHCFQVQSP